MQKADEIFARNIKDIQSIGVWSQNARPHYEDGTTANSKYITGVFDSYDLSKGEFPLTNARRIPIKTAIKELMWIYQDQTSSLDVLKNKYGVKYWDAWGIGDGTIGQRYGATVAKYHIIDRLLKGLEDNPWNRRNVINLWQYADFDETDGLVPCAFMFMVDVRRLDNGTMYLDATLTQRSNDFLVAHHINAMQYVALQMMIAKHFGWKVGKFNYYIQNLHVYSNQTAQLNELASRLKTLESITRPTPKLVLDVPDGTNFYDVRPDDFKLEDYQPLTPQLKFDLAI